MKEQVRAVLFDLDGTLADTLADIAGSVNEVLAERGLPVHPPADFLAFVGEGAEKMISRALPPERQALLPDVLREYHDHYARRLTRETRLYPGIAAMLDAIVARGLVIAVLSNKKDAFTRAVAEALLHRWPFKVVYGERAGVPRKPDPTSALEIARKLEVPPGDCAFVGDTAVDMKTARAAGMFGVGVLWGFRGREELEAAGARVLAPTPMDVVEALCVRPPPR